MSDSTLHHPHPLSELTEAEFRSARDAIVNNHGPDTALFFRAISLSEPNKADLIPYLEAEHAGTLTDSTSRPPRLAFVEYNIIEAKRSHEYIRAIINIETGDIVSKDSAHKTCYAYYTPYPALTHFCVTID